MGASPHQHLQSAALPYRHRANGTAEEAFEKAGVEGDVAQHAEGRYHARKRTHRGSHTVVEVWMHLMRVTREVPHWPERNLREVWWSPARAAAGLVDKPFVASLCRRLAQ